MAGDWIPIEFSTPRKTEVLQLARILGRSIDEALGILVRFWIWADQNSVDGCVDGVVSTDVDAAVDVVGLASALRTIKWLDFDSKGENVIIPNFARINGKSAKKRLLTSRRQSKWRENVDGRVDGCVDGDASTNASTKEEKSIYKTKPQASPAEDDPLWGEAVSILRASGLGEKNARALIGMFLKNWERDDVLAAVVSATGKADPKAYILGILNSKHKKANGHNGEILKQLQAKHGADIRLAENGKWFTNGSERWRLNGEMMVAL